MNFTLGFSQQESIEVILDGIKVIAGHIRDSRQQDSAGFDSVSTGDKSGITGGQGVVPQTEQSSDFVLGDVFSSGRVCDLLVARKETAKAHVQFGSRYRCDDIGVRHSLNYGGCRSECRDTRGVERACNGSNSEEGGT